LRPIMGQSHDCLDLHKFPATTQVRPSLLVSQGTIEVI
jgi:hypothetical protein